MITEWTIRRLGPVNHNDTPRWAILEETPAGRFPSQVASAANLTELYSQFSDLVLTEFGDIAKEVTEA